ncbi:MAG: mcpA 6 [Firmicutes bacterium]|nr:mcpA 6 [Bacillota bacterium]
MRSIKTKLMAVILGITFVAMIAIGGLNYWKARSIIIDDINVSISKEAANSADNIANWLIKSQAELAGITAAPVFQGGNKAEIAAFLTVIMKDNNRFDGFMYTTPDGNYIHSNGTTGNISERLYFQKGIKGEANISDPVVSKSTGKLLVNVAVPVKVNGKVNGILVGQIGLDEMINKVSNIKVGQTGYAYVLQDDGLTIVHQDKDKVMKDNALKNEKTPQSLRTLTERMIKGETGSASYDYNGVNKMVAFAPIQGTTWSLAINVPAAEVTGAMAAFTKMSFITIVVVLVIAGLFIVWFARRIAQPIQELELIANRIADGDVSEINVNITSNDEIGRLGQSFAQMTKNLNQLIRKILNATEQVAASSQELTASSEQSTQASNQIATSITTVAEGTSEQLSAANATAVVVEQMSASIQQIAANANQVAEESTNAAEKAKNGDQSVEKAVAQMNQIEKTVTTSAQVVTKLGERSKEIGLIVDTIAGIASQTNLLALNAAIEAARAGEQGRGFAVVAEEVRKLAEQSQDAAKKIAELIGEIQVDTDKAVIAMDDGTREVKTGAEVVNVAGAAFREIAELVTDVSRQVREISAAMQQMASGSQQIVDSVKTIDNLGKKSASEAQGVSAAAEEQLASMEEIASSSQALAILAQDLQTAANEFQI